MKLYVKNTRPVNCITNTLLLFFLVSFFLQVMWHAYFTQYNIKKVRLTDPPMFEIVRIFSLGDEITVAKGIMFWLQAFDNQPGINIPLKELDYDCVINWLDLILQLDEKTLYPLLTAVRFYTQVQIEEKQRKMISYVKKKFLQAPNDRWQVMAHAIYVARNKIKDLPLASEYARLLRLHATGENVPYWAKQMEFFILEDMGELEMAKSLIGALLESGELKDPEQYFFLEERLKEIDRRQFAEK